MNIFTSFYLRKDFLQAKHLSKTKKSKVILALFLNVSSELNCLRIDSISSKIIKSCTGTTSLNPLANLKTLSTCIIILFALKSFS